MVLCLCELWVWILCVGRLEPSTFSSPPQPKIVSYAYDNDRITEPKLCMSFSFPVVSSCDNLVMLGLIIEYNLIAYFLIKSVYLGRIQITWNSQITIHHLYVRILWNH